MLAGRIVDGHEFHLSRRQRLDGELGQRRFGMPGKHVHSVDRRAFAEKSVRHIRALERPHERIREFNQLAATFALMRQTHITATDGTPEPQVFGQRYLARSGHELALKFRAHRFELRVGERSRRQRFEGGLVHLAEEGDRPTNFGVDKVPSHHLLKEAEDVEGRHRFFAIVLVQDKLIDKELRLRFKYR